MYLLCVTDSKIVVWVSSAALHKHGKELQVDYAAWMQ